MAPDPRTAGSARVRWGRDWQFIGWQDHSRGGLGRDVLHLEDLPSGNLSTEINMKRFWKKWVANIRKRGTQRPAGPRRRARLRVEGIEGRVVLSAAYPPALLPPDAAAFVR